MIVRIVFILILMADWTDEFWTVSWIRSPANVNGSTDPELGLIGSNDRQIVEESIENPHLIWMSLQASVFTPPKVFDFQLSHLKPRFGFGESSLYHFMSLLR
jgi:hypothetical protein